jgi:hypothetical protein
MVGMMNIQKYLDDFHDGSLIDIHHHENEVIFSIESAEMDPSDVKDGIQLSKRGTIKGKLHLKEVKSIQINEVPFMGCLKKLYDSGSIVDLTIEEKMVEIAISWVNFQPKPRVNDFSTIKIEALEIWWENIPDLYDPFW